MQKQKRGFNPNLILKVILIILAGLCLISLSIFSYYLFKVNIIPTKYLVMGFTIVDRKSVV